MSKPRTFRYSGPVLVYDKIVEDNWIAETTASSQRKASSNLKYRWKKLWGLEQTVRVELPGKFRLGDDI